MHAIMYNFFFRKILLPSNFKRTLFFFLFDSLIIVITLYISFALRFEFTLPNEYYRMLSKVLPVFLGVKLISFTGFRMYKITWRYVGINDLCNIVGALIVAESVLVVFILLPSTLHPVPISQVTGFPRSIFLIDGVISLILLSGLRISKRLFGEVVFKKRFSKPGKKTIIVGAGNTGEMILRDMARLNYSQFYPVGLLDDDKMKNGTYVHGVKVIGLTDELERFVQKYDAEAIIVAIPSLNYKTLRGIYESARSLNIGTIKIVPRIYDFHKPDINLKNLEDISIEDLIGRQAVNIDFDEIEKFLLDKVILITGAGGSIGAEIVMQVCAFKPSRIILFDIDETELHNMELRLKKTCPHFFREAGNDIFFAVGDIRDKDRVNEVFDRFKPQIVFHAAAYKHVPMMECNSQEAVKVNIFGTHNLVMAALNSSTNKFIMISTDKAVMPTSIMGATKRIAEYICQAFDNDSSQQSALINHPIALSACPPASLPAGTDFISVRFGNVLGSRGSVLPLFLEQLKNGGPLTVTHKDMQRYFMTIPEAVSLVLQASVIGKGGEVLVLDMGEPVKIVQLAEELIRLHGMVPYKDIEIRFVGLRPGEKLFEEILTAEEGTVASRHKKVFIARNSEKYSTGQIEAMLKEFESFTKNPYPDANTAVKDSLKKYVKHFSDA